jgi:hypothetical protein
MMLWLVCSIEQFYISFVSSTCLVDRNGSFQYVLSRLASLLPHPFSILIHAFSRNLYNFFISSNKILKYFIDSRLTWFLGVTLTDRAAIFSSLESVFAVHSAHDAVAAVWRKICLFLCFFPLLICFIYNHQLVVMFIIHPFDHDSNR